MDRKYIFYILVVVGIFSALFISNHIYSSPSEKIVYEKIDIGFTPEQIWDIINGEDVGIVIKSGEYMNGNS